MRKAVYFVLVLALGVFLTGCEDAPQPKFDYTVEENTVTFKNQTEGQVDEYLWSFGDGQTSNEENPVYTYTEGGDYIVSLLARNAQGANEATKTVTIEGGSGGTVQLPEIEGADALLVAVNNSTFTEQAGYIVEAKLGLASAAFYDQNESLVDVGNVTLNGSELNKNDGNLYSYYEVGATEFSAPITWNIEGGNGFDAVNREVNLAFPKMSRISSGNINMEQDYILKFENPITDADSVIIVVSGANNTYQTAVELTTNEFSIPQSEIADLGATENGIISVSAYQYIGEPVNGKMVYFVNQGNVTKTVRIE